MKGDCDCDPPCVTHCDHNFGVYETDQAPTCSATGKKTAACAICGFIDMQDIPIDPNAHKWGDWSRLDDTERRTCGYDETHVEARAIPDTTAPELSAGSVNRASDTQATIGFTSNEAGTAYYLVQNSGAAAPANTAVKAANNVISGTVNGANSNKAVTLSAGARDIYIVVEDGSGNLSAPLKIEAAAYDPGDTTAPELSAGSVNRASNTQATIGFTSNEAGAGYWRVYDSPSSTPTNTTVKAANNVISGIVNGTNSNKAVTLTAGAKDIYVVVEDSSGNLSAPLKITAAAVYTVTYSLNSGSGTTPTAQTVNAGSSITLPAQGTITRTGYTFGGWNTSTAGTGTNYSAGASYTPAANITLYARWTFTVTYSLNSGSGTTPTTQTVNAGAAITLNNGSGVSRSSYAFGGWNTNTAGTGTNYNAGSSQTFTSGNITLYARWVKTYYSWSSNATSQTITKYNFLNDHITSDFDKAALQSLGYTSFTISVGFEVQQVQDAWVRSAVHPGNLADANGSRATANGPNSGSGGIANSAWGGSDRNDVGSSWVTITYSVKPTLSAFQNTFTVQYDVYSTDPGDNQDQHNLRSRSITVTANK